jgi:hypothetical protein
LKILLRQVLGPAVGSDTMLVLRPRVGVEADGKGPLAVTKCRHARLSQSWLGKFAQSDKWSFCLTAARMAAEQEKL